MCYFNLSKMKTNYKKYLFILFFIILSQNIYAQFIGLGIGITNNISIKNQQLLTLIADISFTEYFNINLSGLYNYNNKELSIYDFGIKGLLQIKFMKPYIGINRVWVLNSNNELFNYMYNVKVGSDIFIYKFLSIGLEFAYYNKFNDLLLISSEKIKVNSFTTFNIKFWF